MIINYNAPFMLNLWRIQSLLNAKLIKAKTLSTWTTFKSHPRPVIVPSYRGSEGAWNEVTLDGISELNIQWRTWSRARQPVDCWTYDLHRMSTVTLETSMSRSRTFKVNDSIVRTTLSLTKNKILGGAVFHGYLFLTCLFIWSIL